MVWQADAESVCEGLLDALGDSQLEQHINMLLAALLGVSALPECPTAYKEQAAKIVLDGDWGKVAKETHQLLAKLSHDEGEQGPLFKKVRAYYEANEV